MENNKNFNDYFIKNEPYYRPQKDEIELALAAYKNRLPML
jgi:hypothetical protein